MATLASTVAWDSLTPDKQRQQARRIQHKARLNEEPTQVERPLIALERGSILALWRSIFQSDTSATNGS
jgi:hypothetical protein